MASLSETVFRKTSGSTVTSCRILPGARVNQFALHCSHGHQVGTATASKPSATSEKKSVRTLHMHNLPSNKSMHLFIVQAVVLTDSEKDLAYSYPFHSNEEVLETLGDMFRSGLYSFDIPAMHSLSSSSGRPHVCRKISQLWRGHIRGWNSRNFG